MKKLFLISLSLLLPAVALGQGTITYNTLTRRVAQFDLQQTFAAITNSAATASTLASYDANKKLIGTINSLTGLETALGGVNILDSTEGGAGANWVALGTTNATLAGYAYVYRVISTNGFESLGDGVTAGWDLYGDTNGSQFIKVTAPSNVSTNYVIIMPTSQGASGFRRVIVTGTNATESFGPIVDGDLPSTITRDTGDTMNNVTFNEWIKLPADDTPTLDADYKFAIDTLIDGHRPSPVYRVGVTNYTVISIPSTHLSTTPDHILKYDATLGTYVAATDNTGVGGSTGYFFPKLGVMTNGITANTNDHSSFGFGEPVFPGTVDTNAFVLFKTLVPEDIDPAVDIKLPRLKLVTAGTDADVVELRVGMATVANSAAAYPTAFSNYCTFQFTPSSPAANDILDAISNGVLTNWVGSLTAGNAFWIQLQRANNSNDDAMTLWVDPQFSYGKTQ